MILDPGYLGPNAFVFFRIFSTALLFLCITRTLFIYEKKDLVPLIICGISGVLGNQLLFFNGLKNTSPVHAALLMVCTPLLVLIIKVWLGEKLNSRQWFACLIGLAGVVSLILSSVGNRNTNSSLLGDLMVFFNALLYGYYLVKVPPLIAKYGPFHILTSLFTFSVLPVGIFAYNELLTVQFQEFGSEEWLAFAFVLLATTFGAYLLNAYALKHTDPSLVSIYIYLQPLIGTAFALWTGKDQWKWNYLLSGILIFTGLFLSGKKNLEFFKKRQETS